MPEAYVHRRVAEAALAKIKVDIPCISAYHMGANGPDVLFTYRVLSRHRPYDLAGLGGRMHDEQCGRFLRTMIFSAATPAQCSYVQGFLTHYAADSVMHPYVTYECSAEGQFFRPEGHGFCEVAMDTMFHEMDTGSPAVPAQDASAKLAPGELAEITQLLHDCILAVYGEDIPHEALADSIHSFCRLHRIFCSPHGGKRIIMWLAEHFILHKPGFGMCHMTPAACPKEGFVSQWVHPFTHTHMTAGPEALCDKSADLSAAYLGAVQDYWLGHRTKQDLAAAIGDRSYSTGLLSTEPAPETEAAPPAEITAPEKEAGVPENTADAPVSGVESKETADEKAAADA